MTLQMSIGRKCLKGIGSGAAGLIAAALLVGGAGPEKPSISSQSPIEAGEYLVAIGGCNDCHTDGWNRNPGKVPVAQRLTGSGVGWTGPWGTSYPTNLRLLVQQMTADRWVQYVATMQSRPPMPWFNVRSMSEPDLRAMYAYIRSLGPAGVPAPDALPPGEKPKTPAIDAVPHPPS
jgi:mono/diheme cytochrome c family protein